MYVELVNKEIAVTKLQYVDDIADIAYMYMYGTLNLP